ncbi:spermidine/putrescine transport system substrate-binding protein [Proteiniborus ethanoligenes]|uniref:Spermidine/putrescine transport system substrate-binding protein n=1 Tax=Proteiniborus ethanoligenes TaxID=415015 RepID=A0A1H3Q0I2_9FIRM|nr:spermidine/putrescine ABC transporter substrate-binding protein [Proteiniborus ethanoligenes]TAH64120.1 MAG: spermidine/putrescine ABC transporter substrate-binding protein [Gottschalkiaceae bacterium]SDZ06638.1 spermidine/putrescine transport system substrate-binding protein [Proteiniborus ethanoligenes]
MKKTLRLVLLSIVILTMVLVSSGCSKEDKIVLNVYNWGDYIDETVIEDFEKEFNIKVNYEDFATNEEMYVKIKSGGTDYDVVFPSDYMIEKMIKEDLLLKLDMANIPNYENIDDRFKNLDFDPNNEYSVPYMWGTVGILYNQKIVQEPVDSWDILWDSKYKGQILMLDSQRDSIAVALKKLGYSMNSRNLQELEEAKEELINQKPLLLAYVGDEVKDMMIGEEAALAVVWSGDAVYMMEENEDLRYVVPKEGSNYWFDNMVIPKTSNNKKEAEMFINYMSRPDVALKNTRYIGYSTANAETMKLLEPDEINNEVAYPSDDVINNCEVFLDPGEFIKEYDRIWTDVKS